MAGREYLDHDCDEGFVLRLDDSPRDMPGAAVARLSCNAGGVHVEAFLRRADVEALQGALGDLLAANFPQS